MLLKKNETKKRRLTLALILSGIIILGFMFFGTPLKMDHPDEKKNADKTGKPAEIKKETPSAGDGTVQKEIVALPAIDYQNLEKDKELKDLLDSRKDSLGIKKSLKMMIVHSDESMKIGDTKVSMRDILEKAFVKEGAVFEEKIDASGAVIPPQIKAYGIYVVQPGDNIWNIHFNILKDFIALVIKDIDAYSNVSADAKESLLNGKNISNLRVFRKYVEVYLKNHNLINPEMMFLVRYLEPTPNGLPLDIWVFCVNKDLVNFEAVQSEIFEHILSVIREFDLKVFQAPTGNDIMEAKKRI